MGGSVELSQKLSVFTDPLKTFSVEQLAVYVSLGYELGLVPAGGGGVGMIYVNRGDPAAYDFVIASLTIDGAWHALDLSSIIPAGASFAWIRYRFRPNVAGNGAGFRANGQTNAINQLYHEANVAGAAGTTEYEGFVKLDAGRVVEYKGSTGLVTFDITVRGWLL